PKPSYVPFLGQYGQSYITGSLSLRRDFIRGDQYPRWSSTDLAAWEFRDYRENPAMSGADATTLLVMHARNYTNGQQMPFGTEFPAGARLRNYGPYGGAFYATVGNDGRLRGDGDANPVIVPSGGYLAFSYDVPELPAVWQGSPVRQPIEIYEKGTRAPTIGVRRKDGKDGDPAYEHTVQVPLVRNVQNLHFVARADGSATNILMKLDGGVDLNSQMNPAGQTPFPVGRDRPPGSATETFLGYEQMRFVQRVSEKFAAQVITFPARDIIGSPGAETWECTVGTAGFIRNDGAGVNSDIDTADWVYHNPGAADINGATETQFSPLPAQAAGQGITVWTKVGYKADAMTRAWIYYTTDGTSFPEGSAGFGKGTTQVASLAFDREGPADANGTPQWWRGTLPALAAGTKLRYKIGVHKQTAGSQFPGTGDQVARKQKMETVFEIAGFNGTTCTVFPHNDLAKRFTGLREGFHVLSTRAFLDRAGKASLFRTRNQTFYYDAQKPTGEIKFPTQNATIGGSAYGFVVLSDASVSDVQFNVLDTNSGNDSAANGNGVGNWAAAQEVTPTQLGSSGYAREWRFDFKNIPTSGMATVQVRFRELSSAASNTLDDEAGWFTTATRSVSTGVPVNYRIRFPEADGATVDTNYVAKIYFDKSLGFVGGQPVDPAQIVNEFTLQLDGKLIPRSGYTFIRDETGSESALAFRFPTFYSGNVDDLHELRATHSRGDVSLTDIRQVRAAPGAILDTDRDNLPDFWEDQHRLDSTSSDGQLGGLGDIDYDGATNLLEFLADTNPRDARDGATVLVPRVERAGAQWKLTFQALRNRRYQIQTSGDLVNWSNSGSSFTVTTSNPAYEWTDSSTPLGKRFYRVRISLQ
ncbi:MAG TPA: hypothetical protein VF614_14570, partial [Chthoniobacteraceae bacterium]